MKNRFSIFKNKALFCLVIALMFVALPLSAEESCRDCCCEESNDHEFEWTDPLEKTVKFGYDMYEYVPLMRGPLLIISAPALGTGIGMFATDGDSVKEKIWKLPCLSAFGTGCVFCYGVAQTLTLGNLQ
jgi:hypothetical protein